MQENTDQNNSEYGHFLRSDIHLFLFFLLASSYLIINKKPMQDILDLFRPLLFLEKNIEPLLYFFTTVSNFLILQNNVLLFSINYSGSRTSVALFLSKRSEKMQLGGRENPLLEWGFFVFAYRAI